MMTKKDFKKFAQLLADTYPDGINLEDGQIKAELVKRKTWRKIKDKMIEVFRSDNPRFDSARFNEACYP